MEKTKRKILVSAIWKDPNTPWAPSVTISETDYQGELTPAIRDAIVDSWLRYQNKIHPERQFCTAFYVADLDELLLEEPVPFNK